MKPVTAIIFKDIVIEMRSKESISSMLMFGVLVLTIFSFAFEPSSIDRSLIAPGILWVAFSFAAILGLNRSLAMEMDNETRLNSSHRCISYAVFCLKKKKKSECLLLILLFILRPD